MSCKATNADPLWIPLITIKSRPATVDSFGQPAVGKTDIESWLTGCTTSGFRRNPNWGERVGIQITDRIVYVVETLWNATPVVAGMRAVFGGVVYEIQSVVDPDMRQVMRNLLVLSIDEAV